MTPTERVEAIELAKRRVEACYEDYRVSVLSYAEWMDAWRKRQKQKAAA